MTTTLTHSQILNMEAGPELNELLHELIFHKCAHVLTVDPEGTSTWSGTSYKCRKCGLSEFDFTTDYEGRHTGTPNYGTDIAAAWQIVDKLKGARFSLVYWQSYGFWIAAFGTQSTEPADDESCAAPTPELAICRAVLLATLEK